MQRCWKWSRRLGLFTLIVAGVLAAQLRPFPRTAEARQAFLQRFAAAALARTQHAVRYDPAYVRLAYPGGDVPADTGVCTDEVIRAYRAVGIDLQKEVHEDMAGNFNAYPKKWGRREPDPNIDHRRVPNLMVFFNRKGESLPITDRARLRSGRFGDLGLGRRVDPYWHGRGQERRVQPPLHDRAQHRRRTEDGRCPIRMEDHGPLPLLRSAISAQHLAPHSGPFLLPQ